LQRPQVLKELENHFLPVRSSYCNDLATCPRYFMLRNRYGLKPVYFQSAALSVGTAYHHCIEGLYRTGSEVGALSFAGDALCSEQEAVRARANEEGLLPDGTPAEYVLTRMDEAQAEAQMMFLLASPSFFGCDFIRKNKWEVLAVEEVLSIQYEGIVQPIVCQPDALLVRPHDGAILIDSHKTTSYDISDLTIIHRFAVQKDIERLCVASYFPQAPAIYHRMNVARKCRLKFPTKTRTTFDQYLQDAADWYKDLQEKDPDNPPFSQVNRLLTGPIMSAELHARLSEVSMASRALAVPDRFPRHDSACLLRGKACEYLPLCGRGVETWPDTLERLFYQEFRDQHIDPVKFDTLPTLS
jgi:hypothetical protein